MPKTPQPVLLDSFLDQYDINPQEGRFLLEDEQFRKDENPRFITIDGNPLFVPHFTTSEVARAVLGRDPAWLKWRFKDRPRKIQQPGATRPATHYEPLTLRGEPLTFRLVKGRGGQERRMTLADIERLAWSLYEAGDIDHLWLRNIYEILIALAANYGNDLHKPRGMNG